MEARAISGVLSGVGGVLYFRSGNAFDGYSDLSVLLNSLSEELVFAQQL